MTRAVEQNSLGLLRVLLQTRKPSTAVADQLLVVAVHCDHRQCVQLLLSSGASANAVTRCGGASVLHRAVAHKSDATVQLLVEASANVMALDDHRQTALHHAARSGAALILDTLP